jgi:hypothetical protein
MLGPDQERLLQWTLDLLDGDVTAAPPDELPFERLQAAAFASGLTAAATVLAERIEARLPAAWQAYFVEQTAQVGERQRRFRELLPRVLAALDAARIGAVPVKGAVLATAIWPCGEARPMADLDLLISADDRAAARVALEASGLAFAGSNAWEDTYLGWGDGGVGRLDGESAAHNGKVELHPGWVERLHNYLVDDGGLLLALSEPGELVGAPCLRLPAAAFAVHVVGHLSASVIRAEVRALNVLDAVLVLRALDGPATARLFELVERLDGRLSGPGLWLVSRMRPDAVAPGLLEASVGRLPSVAMDRLSQVHPSNVLRDPARRTNWAWRSAFTTSLAERARMARQFAWPPASDLGPLGAAATGRSTLRLQMGRAGRVAGRALHRT